MRPSARRGLRNFAAAAAAALAASLAVAPALADKPLTALDETVSTAVTAIPIDFDRENPSRKEFGKLIFRGGLNLFAKSSYFGGYSAIALDPTGSKLLAISDAGSWMKADLDYNGRELRGLSNVTLGPILGQDGKPLLADQDRDSEGMTLAEGTPDRGLNLAPTEMRHALIHAQDPALSVVHDDRIADRVKCECPLALHVVHLLKEQNVLQGQTEQVADIFQLGIDNSATLPD